MNSNLQLGSLLSIYGCYGILHSGCDKVNHIMSDAERGTYVAPTLEENVYLEGTTKNSVTQEEHYVRRIAGLWGYAFQIIYQVIFPQESTLILMLMKNVNLHMKVPKIKGQSQVNAY